MLLNDLIQRLFDIEAITFDEFSYKNGLKYPFKVDLRLIQSYPILLKAISESMWNKIQSVDFEVLCAVAYNAIPFTTAISMFHNIPMIIKREDKVIEGVVKASQRCVVIGDLITTGGHLLETTEILKFEGLIVKDVVVIVDMEQGGKTLIENKKINFHSLFSIDDVLNACGQKNF